jgi:Uma2 family endonuclease
MRCREGQKSSRLRALQKFIHQTTQDCAMLQEHKILTEEHRVVRSGVGVEEYLAFENASEERHEFHNGDIIAMPGNTGYHEHLMFKIMLALGKHIAAPEYWIFGSNLKTMIPTYNRYVYPDVTIVRGEAAYNDAGKRELLNPTVVIEVLSPSTADFDLTRKFEYYRSIPSLEEIAYFEPERAFAQLFRKNAQGRWEIVEIENGIVEFASVQARISLTEIYPPNR